MPYTLHDNGKMIDHSLLRPTMTVDELEQGICLARKYDVASVCILPYYLKRCAELLRGSDVKASTTIGFPHGGHTTAIKVAEARQALDDGGVELDMVVNLSNGRFAADAQVLRPPACRSRRPAACATGHGTGGPRGGRHPLRLHANGGNSG